MALQPLGSVSEWWTAPVFFSLGCCVLHLSWRLLEKRRRGPLKPWSSLPGPGTLATLLEFASMPKGRPQIHRLWQRLANEHGPLYRVSLPFKKFVVVADPRLVSGIMGRKGLPKSAMYKVTLDVFSFRGRHDNMFTVMSTHDPKWLTARKGFAATVSEDAVRSRFPLVTAATEKLREALDARVLAEEGGGGGEESGAKRVAAIEMQEASLRLALDVILAAAFEAEGGALEMIGDGKDETGDTAATSASPPPSPPLPPYSFKPCSLLDSLHECFEYIYGSLEKPWLLPLFRAAPFLPAARRHWRQHERLYEQWSTLVAHVRARKGTAEQLEAGTAPGYDGSYGSCLVRLVDHKTGKLQKDEQILSQASATVVAGMDTTAHALSFALLCIATTPGVQEKVAAELESVGLLMSSSSENSARPLEYADLARIPYLTAVIKESMRLWPVGGAGVGRVADRDVDVGGYFVKKGTEVAVPMFCLHRAPWAWTDADAFDPGRWLEEGEEGARQEKRADATATVTLTSSPSSRSKAPSSSRSSSSSDSQNLPKPLRLNAAAYLPFSAGPRDCLGRRFGMMELGTMLAMLCSKYEFEFDDELNPGGLEGIEEREVSKFTLSLDGGLWLKANPR